MSDTAAFFAKKKTKKKKFKSFNANKIDASAVTTATHVDAPDISAEHAATSLGGLRLGGAIGGTEDASNGNDQWADSQGGWGSKSNATAPTTSGDSKVAELLDMQALNAKRNQQDDVAERLRIEETKEKLARAKEGMAKEAERLEAEKANKEAKAVAKAGGQGGAMGGASTLGGGAGSGGKWIPSHMRNTGGLASGGSLGSRFGMATRGPASMDGAGFQKPVDTANEELFPDLAAAANITAEKEKQAKDKKERLAGRAPVGWGAAAAATTAPAQRKPLNLVKPPAERKPLNLAPSKKAEEEPALKKAEKKEESPPAAEATIAASPAPAVAAPAAALAATPAPEKPAEKKKVLKKKKKKDLSTFKPKS